MIVNIKKDSLLNACMQIIAPVKYIKSPMKCVKYNEYSDLLNSIGHNIPTIFGAIERHPYVALGICAYFLSKHALKKICNSIGIRICAYIDGTAYLYMKRNGMVRNFSEFLIYKRSLQSKSSDEENITIVKNMNQLILAPQIGAFLF